MYEELEELDVKDKELKETKEVKKPKENIQIHKEVKLAEVKQNVTVPTQPASSWDTSRDIFTEEDF